MGRLRIAGRRRESRRLRISNHACNEGSWRDPLHPCGLHSCRPRCVFDVYVPHSSLGGALLFRAVLSSMAWIQNLWRSSIGGKLVMAVTGLLLFGFLVTHLVGNLLLFGGPEAINSYAQGLKDLGPLLWVARIGLLAVFVLHVITALRLQSSNREARPQEYIYQASVQASCASRYMLLTGLVVLVYLLYHLMHFTFGWIQPGEFSRLDIEGRHDVYTMVVQGFRHPVIALTYVAAQVLLFLHLRHGLHSAFQSLGVRHPRYSPLIETGGMLLALLIPAGNILIVVAVAIGVCPLPAGVPS